MTGSSDASSLTVALGTLQAAGIFRDMIETYRHGQFIRRMVKLDSKHNLDRTGTELAQARGITSPRVEEA
jgi:hypothetical protein